MAAFFKTARPVNRAAEAGSASSEEEKMIGMTPELLTCTNPPKKV